MKNRAAVVVVRFALALIVAVLAALWIVSPADAETVTIGGNMDHGLTVRPGDTIKGGFQVFLEDNPHGGGAASLVVTGGVITVTINCKKDDDHGHGNDKDKDKDKNNGPDRQTLTIPLSPRTYSIPTNGNFSSPANDYQGQITAPTNLCGGHDGTVDGVTFSANSAFTCHANSSEGCCHKVCFHFHVLYNNRGGTFSRKECEHERECASPTKHGKGHCCDKDRDRD
jgi:hypothetical protein